MKNRAGTVISMLAMAMAMAMAAMPMTSPAADQNSSKATSGQTWASIERLPDWSGTWAMTVKDHEGASKETLADDGGLVPFTPAYQKARADLRGRKLHESLAQCLPAGIPGVMLHRIGFELLFTPGRLTMITENGEVRRIHTDGRPHQSLPVMDGSYEGDSIGHWEGQTLVVDTIGFPNGSLLKNGDLTATINTHYVERITNTDKDHLQIESTISDPAIYTKPYQATRHFERVDYPLPEPQCAQTSRGSDENMNLKAPE